MSLLSLVFLVLTMALSQTEPRQQDKPSKKKEEKPNPHMQYYIDTTMSVRRVDSIYLEQMIVKNRLDSIYQKKINVR